MQQNTTNGSAASQATVLVDMKIETPRVRINEAACTGCGTCAEVCPFGLPIRWVSRIEEWEPPVRFVDVQVKGPFSRWRHEHIFEDGALIDRVDYEVPLALAGGRLVDFAVVRPDLRRMFRFRHEATAQRLLGKR